MQQKTANRTYAFIDSQNLNVGVQKFGWKLDWRKFRKFLASEYGVTKAFMFIGYLPENESLYEQMHQAGYAVVLKWTFDLTKPRPEESKDDEKPVKGNIDADLVLWAMKEIGNYDKAVIVSGDGDFFSLVEYLVGKKRLLHLLTPSGHYSQLYNALTNMSLDWINFGGNCATMIGGGRQNRRVARVLNKAYILDYK